MNHKQFGLLVKAMRHEMQRQEGTFWTQAYLAERANATPKVISNLERGVKARLEPELLIGLARAFGLSAAERRVFFGLANRLLDMPPAENSPSPKDILQPLLHILRSTRQPAFLVDGYDNVVAVNHLLLGLFPFVRRFLDTPEPFPGAYNAMRFVFSSESGFAQRVTENRERYLQHSICRFRAITLPYRATRYYQRMMHTFLHSADMALFAELYRSTSTEDADFHTPGYRITFTQPEARHPISMYAPTTTVIDSPYGALYLVMHIPADMPTLEHFYSLAHAHPPKVYRIAPWPLSSELMEFDDEDEELPPE